MFEELRNCGWFERSRKKIHHRQRNSHSIEAESQDPLDGRHLLLILTAIVGDTPSGGDYLVQELTQSFIANDVEVRVIAAESSIEHLRTGIRERLVPIRGKISNGNRVGLAYLARSIRLIRISRTVLFGQKPDIVMTGSVFLPDLVGAFLLTGNATAWVLSWQLDVMPPSRKYFRNHSMGAKQKLRQGFRASLSFACQEITLVLAKRRRAVLIVPSHELKDRALARGFSDSKIVVCGVTLDRPKDQPCKQFRDRTTDFLFLGRFHAQKGLHDLLIAWDRIHVALPHLRLRVAGGGDGNLAKWFVQEMAKRADTVEYLGIVKGNVKWDLLDDTKVVLFPSTYESLGIVALEAFAAGAVVVGYEIPSTTEAFGDGVIQVPPSDPQHLALEAIDIIQNQSAWRSQQQKGFQMIEQYLSRDSPESTVVKVLSYSKKLPD